MQLWHLTPDAARTPHRVSPGEWVALDIGTWPVEPGHSVRVTYRVEHTDGTESEDTIEAAWRHNQGENSYWRAELGPFAEGDVVRYTPRGGSIAGDVTGPEFSFRVGPRLYLALLWHQHQPLYKDLSHPSPAGSYAQPWVRLHAIRDYYSMAALVAEHPEVHLTINLTPVLLWQIQDYVERGATDRSLELTLERAEALSPEEREEVLATFFDADWHNQIFPHPRYKELFAARQAGRPATTQDIRDLQMWFNLAWFGKEFRDGDVRLATGEVASVRRFVERQRDFTHADIIDMIAEQYKILRAILPLHRELQQHGQVEVSTTPFYHPILPLIIDTDQATLDRPGTRLPPRFASPQDAEAQVRMAADLYRECFGQPPRGMWPAEGAVSQAVVPYFARHGIEWIATDGGVLARSGRWGYAADDPNVHCQPYRAEEGESTITVFFRDAWLADHIGFHYQRYGDYGEAAREFLAQIKSRFAEPLTGDDDRVLTVVLDGENAWGAYREDARPFLHALYGLLAHDTVTRTVTFAEYLAGNPVRGLRAHPRSDHARVFDLYTGSWIDEIGSLPGVDLGTWIGEPEENRAWDLLRRARAELTRRGAIPETAPDAFAALYAAEGSDWFWWLGTDQESAGDALFDDLFRTHLRTIFRSLGAATPAWLDEHIVPRAVTWTFTRPTAAIQPGDRLSVQTNCPGVLTWRLRDSAPRSTSLAAAGGVMAGARRHYATLGPFDARDGPVRFRFRCTAPDCDGRDICCRQDEQTVRIDGKADSADDHPLTLESHSPSAVQ
jgi:alpha-amylase/alpha-mannosidase (GH57 family)